MQVKAWYSDIEVESLSITHHATAIDATDSSLMGDSITALDGKTAGLVLMDSEVIVDALSTRVFSTTISEDF